jgi:hypothetical protein
MPVRAKAEQQHAEKLRQEEKFAPKVLALLNELADEATRFYSETGAIFNAQDYHQDFLDMLLKEYTWLTNYWGNTVEKDEDSDLAAAILAARLSLGEIVKNIEIRKDEKLANFAVSSSIRSAQEITDTNQKELEAAIAAATVALIDLEIPVTQKAVAEVARESLRNTNLWRADTIAATEVNNGAEGSKNIEYETIGNELAAAGLLLRIRKSWQTMGDGRVRPAHRAANGQVVAHNESFVVGGELLRWPADPMGSAGNTINCRCTAVEVIG